MELLITLLLSLPGGLPDLHLCLHLQFLRPFLLLVLLNLLCCELVDISRWQPMFADSPQEQLVGLQQA